MWQEFKSFAFKGNAFDLAVGVIIGGAFGKIVDSLVNDLIMPIIGLLIGGIDFSGLSVMAWAEHNSTQTLALHSTQTSLSVNTTWSA